MDMIRVLVHHLANRSTGKSEVAMNSGVPTTWSLDWAWGLPLIVMAVVFHAQDLGLVGKKVHAKLNNSQRCRKLSSSLTYIDWRNRSCSRHFARVGGCNLGSGLPHSWSFAG
jgi:hypothetical protein